MGTRSCEASRSHSMMPPAAEPAATCELPMLQNVAPMPPRHRPKPQLRTVGPGKKYPDRVAFDADLVRWHAERAERKKVMLVRRQSQQRRRHRADRIRPDNDNERRARQRKDKKRSVLGKIFQRTGRPALADLIDRKKGNDEFEALDMWARYEVGGRVEEDDYSDYHDNIILEWRATEEYKSFVRKHCLHESRRLPRFVP